MTKYQADVTIELDLDGDDEAAFRAIDEIMQRAWDTDRGRRWVDQAWHFSMTPGCVSNVTEDLSVDEAVQEDQLAHSLVVDWNSDD